MSKTPETFASVKKRWRGEAQSDRDKNYDINARLQKGETVLINTAPYGPYKDMREACADELESGLEQRVRKLRDRVIQMAQDVLVGALMPSCENPILVSKAIEAIAGNLTALLGEEPKP